MRSLDRFYEYLEKQERAKQEEEGPKPKHTGEPAPLPGATAAAAAGTAVAEKPEGAAAAAVSAAPPKAEKKAPKKPLPRPAELPGAALPGYKYVLRGGVTVAVPDAPSPEPAAAPDAAAPASSYLVPIAPEEIGGIDVIGDEGDEDDEDDGLLADEGDYLPPLVEADEPPLVADASARPRAGGGLARRGAALASDEDAAAVLEPVAELSEGDAAALWRRLPRHIQLLVGMNPEPSEEVAQKYYTRGFKETRQQLIERLLDPTLTLEDTARVLGVCPTTVRRYTNRGTLPCYRTVGQQRRFRLSDVLAFLEKQRHAEAKQAAKGRKGAAAA